MRLVILWVGKKTTLDLNKISVLAGWKPAFILKTNSWIGKYQRFFIKSICYSLITKLWKTFVEALTKFLCLCWKWFYWTNIHPWYFYTHWNIHPEVFYTSTRLFIVLQEYTFLLSKNKRLFQLALMIAYFDPCFWSKPLKN